MLGHDTSWAQATAIQLCSDKNLAVKKVGREGSLARAGGWCGSAMWPGSRMGSGWRRSRSRSVDAGAAGRASLPACKPPGLQLELGQP